jgi:hypothetical protein
MDARAQVALSTADNYRKAWRLCSEFGVDVSKLIARRPCSTISPTVTTPRGAATIRSLRLARKDDKGKKAAEEMAAELTTLPYLTTHHAKAHMMVAKDMLGAEVFDAIVERHNAKVGMDAKDMLGEESGFAEDDAREAAEDAEADAILDAPPPIAPDATEHEDEATETPKGRSAPPPKTAGFESFRQIVTAGPYIAKLVTGGSTFLNFGISADKLEKLANDLHAALMAIVKAKREAAAAVYSAGNDVDTAASKEDMSAKMAAMSEYQQSVRPSSRVCDEKQNHQGLGDLQRAEAGDAQGPGDLQRAEAGNAQGPGRRRDRAAARD